MSNGEVCCILQVCCPPEALGARRKALRTWLVQSAGCHADCAEAVAKELLDAFDFAPAGTIGPLVRATAEMARTHHE